MERYMKKSERIGQERAELVAQFIGELPILRTKLAVSQDELASMIGITRQTYSTFETGRRPMSWSIFLALVLIFDNDERTRQYLRSSGLFPGRLLGLSGPERSTLPLDSFVQMEGDDIRSHLDDQAIHAIETVIMMEYARCEKMTGDAVIRAFDGKRITLVSQRDQKVAKALKGIRSRTRNQNAT